MISYEKNLRRRADQVGARALRAHGNGGATHMIEPTPKRADVLVIFGITGDLAKKMTFRALYRLEAANRLDCPVLGVAKEPWSDDHLRATARTALEATGEPVNDDIFDRLAGRLGYVHGDFADPATYKVLSYTHLTLPTIYSV